MHVGLAGSKLTRTGSEIVEGIRVRPNIEGSGRSDASAGLDGRKVGGRRPGARDRQRPSADAGGTGQESQLHRSPAGRRLAVARG